MHKSILSRMMDIFIDDNVNLIKKSLDELLEFEIDDVIDDESFNKENIETNIDENEFINNKNKFYYVINIVIKGILNLTKIA